MKFFVVFALLFSAVFALPSLRLNPAERVQAGKAPFVASLQICAFNICESDCTAVVLSETLLLTSAWCAIMSWDVVIGATNLPDDDGTAVINQVSGGWIHPDYDRVTSANDIAILKLISPLTFGDKVKALPLPKQGEAPSETDPIEIYGYPDRTAAEGPLLVAKNQTLISLQDCSRALGNTIRSFDTVLCTASASSTDGDQGGPVVQNGVLIGITSTNTSNGITNPGVFVFTPTNLYANWIANIEKII